MLIRRFPPEAILIRHSVLVSESANGKQTLKQVQGDILQGVSLLGETGGYTRNGN